MSVPHFTSEDTEAQGALIICLKLTGVFIPKARHGWWKAGELGCLHGNSFFFFVLRSSVSLVSSSAPSVSSFHGYSVGAAMPGKSVVINGFLCMPDVSCTHRVRTATGAHRVQFPAEEGVPALVCHSRGSGTWSWMSQTLPRVQLPSLHSGRLCGWDETGAAKLHSAGTSFLCGGCWSHPAPEGCLW